MSTNASAEPANLVLDKLTVRYGDLSANDSVSLECPGGQFTTLLGPSGSGKTTSLKVIAGFLSPTDGQVLLDGKPLVAPPHKRDIGVVFQNYALFPHLTAAENVAYPLRMRGLSKKDRLRRAGEALELVDLGARGGHKPGQLSGGQQQRVALARALVFEPRVILMDEPLGALDKNLRESLQLEIRQLQQELKITTIYVTHDQEEALVMSDQIAIYESGRISQVGSADDLYERPDNEFVAKFVGESNMFPVTVDSDTSCGLTEFGPVRLPARRLGPGPATLVVRPERLEIHKPGTERNGLNTREAKVSDVVYLGSARRYEFSFGNGETWIARHSNRDGDYEPAVGDEVLLGWWPERASLVPRAAHS